MVTGKLYTLENANERLHSVFPELTLLNYTDSKTLCDIQSSRCGHIWKGSLNNVTSKIGGHICRVCNPSESAKYSLEKANINLKSKFPELEFLEYKGSNTPTIIKSLFCGHTWEGRPRNVLSKHSGYVCRVCNPANNSTISLKQANDRLTQISKDLVFLTYKGLQIPSDIKSLSCGHTWKTTLNNLTTGNTKARCIVCYPSNKVSSEEKEILNFIKSIYSGWVLENDRLSISPLELDIVIPDLGIAIEYNGNYWHREDKFRHIEKTIRLKKEIDYDLIHISSSDWKNKQNIVKSRLKSVLGLLDVKLYARKCIVKEISFPSKFLLDNHIQGIGSNTSINVGLFHKDILVSVMTFAKSRFNKNYDYELVRFCSLLNTQIIGGASKLVKYFKTNYSGSIISYSDKRWSTGNLYKKLGFELLHTTDPGYTYYKDDYEFLSRYQCQKHLLKDKFPEFYDINKTETEIMQLAGFYRVYDCGNDVWVYK